ncbi:MAG: hypothetical protein DWQ02_28840 [Bacteroidetes bacterium]|nr:MAG: hypothetical protein DWQ02_28840 [Bacteroidota bacterium]
MLILKNGNVGIGTTSPGRALEINNALKLSNSGGVNGNDGVIGVATFAQGLNIVGIRTDGTHRKIGLWGSIIQHENIGGNAWKGTQEFDGKVGIGTSSPIANLDITQGKRTGSHPGVINGLYVTGNFGDSNNGVEFRHSNGTQGIGFGYNSIYATGTYGDQSLNLIPKGKGKVGVGTTSPQALLHVASKNTNYRVGKVRALNMAYNDVVDRHYGSINTSILADASIVSKAAVFAVSDLRIKKDISPTSSSEDLVSLRAIEVVDYKMIDSLADSRSYKKVIAQQLQSVYPLAVEKAPTAFIPNVFQPSTSIVRIQDDEYRLSVAEPHQLVVNDRVDVKCYPGNTSVVTTVSKIISPTDFVVTSETSLDDVEFIFVYGKQVHDLLSVDYGAVSMLNVSATQELAKQTEALQAENKALKARVADLERQVDSLEELKASVAQLQSMIQDQKTDDSSTMLENE